MRNGLVKFAITISQPIHALISKQTNVGIGLQYINSELFQLAPLGSKFFHLDSRSGPTLNMDAGESNPITNDDVMTSKLIEPSDLDIKVHYVFLVHGWLGNDLEMSYIESAIRKADANYNYSNFAKLVVHCTKTNNGKTSDGIAKGGKRLAEEIESFIRRDVIEQFNHNENSSSETHVSISLVGNSLGGLYSRFAISQLPTLLEASDRNNNESSHDSKIVIHRNLFCTTACPHLGVASHTYITIPRFAEQIVGRALSKTGKDLFRLRERYEKDLIYQMSTDYELFLMPLLQFKKRLAYVNAFSTDFQVPTSTAAFLSGKSAYPHCVIEPSLNGKKSDQITNESPFIVTTVTTEKSDKMVQFDSVEEKEMKNDDLIMSNKIDSLGWTKVFIDVRDKIPGPSMALPSFFVKNRRQSWDKFLKTKKLASEVEDNTVVTSQELAQVMRGSESVHLPLGHTVMVANAKNSMYANLNAGGKPVMDKLANDLLQDIFTVCPPSALNNSNKLEK